MRNQIAGTRYRTAEDLERALGDPARPTGPFSHVQLAEADDSKQMPWAAMAALRAFGFHRFLVPERLGGRLRSLEEFFALCRSVARRDLRPIVAYGSTLLGANPVWLWGTSAQQRLVAGHILTGGLGSFAMSERDHGSDLAGCACAAERQGDDFVLRGEKWLVGNASRGEFLTLYAKTGRRDFSLLLVDKRELSPGGWRNLPAVPTLGLRGHDLSGIVFEGCSVPGDALLGHEGTGLVQTLKALQITRTLISAMSLGTLDTCLRIAAAHAAGRRLYGAPASELPAVRDVLLRAYLDLLIGECLAIPTTRAITEAPGRLSLWSAIVKYFVPLLAEEAVADLATVLSARYYLRDTVAARTFQRLQRDHAIAGIFEGTSHVNLGSIAAQLPFVLDRKPGGDPEPALTALFSRSRDARAWQPRGADLQLTNGGHDEITAGWEPAVAEVARLAGSGDRTATALVPVMAEFGRWRARYSAEVLAQADGHRDRHVPARSLTLAKIHCVCHAAACAVLTWLHNRERYAGQAWVVLCLQRLLQRLDASAELDTALLPELERQLETQRKENLLLSLAPITLAN
ncbi:acyl-CoA dehydrogenase family protein [Rhizohabitans arisaemae]|uniref:acyl-CoA dehydrogenase family protein n=1 Tax=Rhizohabitans arisaemae TaxID=2720610 RepID=UPI0024B0AB80|nr:acyl-CoA dehydrogenase family protein [Rhizohabitans arisaemae]